MQYEMWRVVANSGPGHLLARGAGVATLALAAPGDRQVMKTVILAGDLGGRVEEEPAAVASFATLPAVAEPLL
jgi:hypothetical protein